MLWDGGGCAGERERGRGRGEKTDTHRGREREREMKRPAKREGETEALNWWVSEKNEQAIKKRANWVDLRSFMCVTECVWCHGIYCFSQCDWNQGAAETHWLTRPLLVFPWLPAIFLPWTPVTWPCMVWLSSWVRSSPIPDSCWFFQWLSIRWLHNCPKPNIFNAPPSWN